MSSEWSAGKISAGLFVTVVGGVITALIVGVGAYLFNDGSDISSPSASATTSPSTPLTEESSAGMEVTPSEDPSADAEDAMPSDDPSIAVESPAPSETPSTDLVEANDEATEKSEEGDPPGTYVSSAYATFGASLPATRLTDIGTTNLSGNVDVGITGKIDGLYYMDSIVYLCSNSCDSTSAFIEYDLGGNYSRLAGTVGVGDCTDYAGQAGVFRAYGDGKLIEQWDVGQWCPDEVDVSVEGVSVLRLEWERSTGSPINGSYRSQDLVWGEPTVY